MEGEMKGREREEEGDVEDGGEEVAVLFGSSRCGSRLFFFFTLAEAVIIQSRDQISWQTYRIRR